MPNERLIRAPAWRPGSRPKAIDNNTMPNSLHTLDEAHLAKYLESRIEGFKGPISTTKFPNGQSNPTFLINTANDRYVLRRKPPGDLLPSAHAVDREYRVLKSLSDTDVPVAKVYHLCKDDSVIGSMFYVMSYEDGRVFWNPALPELKLNDRRAIYDEKLRILAALHDIDVAAIGLEDYGKPGNYFERQINRWSKQYRASETTTIEPMESLLEWLPANVPVDDDLTSLIHGDYRLDNMIFAPDDPNVLAILDWELSTLGNPLADLSYYCMCLRLPVEGPIIGLAGIDREATGIPGESEIIEQYCGLRGIPGISNWNFYMVFNFFRLASICQGVLKRSLEGNASSEAAVIRGNLVQPLAEMGINVISR